MHLALRLSAHTHSKLDFIEQLPTCIVCSLLGLTSQDTRLCGLNGRNLFSHRSGVWKFKIKFSGSLF